MQHVQARFQIYQLKTLILDS